MAKRDNEKLNHIGKRLSIWTGVFLYLAAKEQTSAYADTLRYLINRQDALDARQESYAREDAQRAAAYAQQLLEEQREAEEKAEAEAKPTLTVAQVNAAIKAGVLTDAVRAAYEYYYGEPYRR